jgi:NAD(P)-dependent dehydrogenase (short-subunit alcohol dehydrogenase family)
MPGSIDLTGVRVVVTGGATGIGRAACLLLADSGARVAVLDLDVAAGTRTATDIGTLGGSATFVRVDVADPGSVERAFATAVEQLGGLDGVINCAGIMKGQHIDIGQLAADVWAQVLAVNLTGSFLVAREAATHLRRTGAGVLILIGSKAGVVGGSGSLAYGASKGGVHGLAMALERSLAEDGIRLFEVCPGTIDTPLLRASHQEALANGAVAPSVEVDIGTAEGIASVLAFLLTPGAAYLPLTILLDKPLGA